MLGNPRPITIQESNDARRRWFKLKQENAPFRIVTDVGLVSAPVDTFDPLLLEQATTEWQRIIRVVAGTMGHNSDIYIQVGVTMLATRVVALINEGRLLADGDPWDMRTCRVRLPA